LFSILRDSTLAVFTASGGEIERFRHRRLQDYFVALHIDRVGLSQCPAILGRLSNAWLREPLRIYAAIGRAPQDLLLQCISAFESIPRKTDLNAFARLHLATNVLANASSAVAYLPTARHDASTQALVDAVLALGKQTHDLYHLLLSESAAAATGSRSEAYLLRIKCLESFRNIYSSEFLATPAASNAQAVWFDTCYQTDEKVNFNSWISIYRKTLKQGEPYQHLSYSYLYPIRDAHDQFPVDRFSLFLFVAEVVLVFEQKYHELVHATHATKISRLPLALASATCQLFTLMVPVGILLLWYKMFGWSIVGVVLLGMGALAVVFLMSWAQERGMIGERRELKALPFWAALVWTKRALTKRIVVPEPAIDQLPTSILTPTPHAFVALHQISSESKRRPLNETEAVPSSPAAPTEAVHQRKFSVPARSLAWIAGLVLSTAGLVEAFPWMASTSQAFVHHASVLELRVKASLSRRDVPRLAGQTSSMLSRQAGTRELDSIHARLTAKIQELEGLLATANALNEGLPGRVPDVGLAKTITSLSAAREEASAIDGRVSVLLGQENNAAEWDSLNKSIEEFRAKVAGFSQPLPDTPISTIEVLLKEHADTRTGLQALRAEALTFQNLLLPGGRRPETETGLGKLEVLKKTLDVREILLLSTLSSARLRAAVSEFSNGVPVLVIDIQTAVRAKIPASLPALRAETKSASELSARLSQHLEKGRSLLEQQLVETTKDEIRRGLLKLEAVRGVQDEHSVNLERQLALAEVDASLHAIAATTDKLTSDLQELMHTKFASPEAALSDFRQIREQFQSALREAVSIKQQATIQDQSDTVTTQIGRLTDGISVVAAETSKWNARLDVEKRNQAIGDLRARVQLVLTQSKGSSVGFNDLVREISAIETAWDNLNRPVELKIEIDQARNLRRQVESKMRSAQRQALPAVAAAPRRTNSAAVSLLEDRCSSVAQYYTPEASRTEDVDVFLAHDAAALRNDMSTLARGPQILSHISGSYRSAKLRLTRFHEIDSSLPALKQITSGFITPARDILADSRTSATCREKLANIIRSAEGADSKIRAIEELGQQMTAMDFGPMLLKTESEARQQANALGANVLIGIVLAVVIVMCLIVYSRISDRRGLRELKRHQYSFDDLLAFSVSNTYSRAVNFRTIAFLQARITHNPETLRKLSDAAQEREKRGPGVLHGDVATRLREIATGLDNILNR